MHLHRLYSPATLRTAPLLLIAMCAGCWEKIEYTGASPVAAAPRTTQPLAIHESTDVNPSKAVEAQSVASDSAGADGRAERTPPYVQQPSLPFAGTNSEPVQPKPEGDRYATPAVVDNPAPPATPPVSEPDKSLPSNVAELATPHTDATPVSATADVAPPAKVLNSRRTAWLLGSRLSLAALANDRGVAAKSVPIWFEDSRTAAKLLGTTVLDLPEPAATSDNAPASRQVINYLVVNGQRIGRELSQKHGPEQSALFEIALKSNILLLLYSPGASEGNSIAAAISRAAPQAKLPAELWQPLIVALGKQAPQGDVRAAVRKMHIDADQYLAEAAEQNGR